MSAIVILEMHVKPGSVEEVKATLKSVLPDTRAYAGFQSIDIYEDQNNKDTLVFYEKWDTHKHYEKYLAWRTETGVLAQLGTKLTEPPNIRFFERVDA